MNRFAQAMYGRVIYIFETDLQLTDLPSIFSPKQYWFDVTGIDCEVGYIIDVSDGTLKFRKPTEDEKTIAQAQTVRDSLQRNVMDYLSAEMVGNDTAALKDSYKNALTNISDDVALHMPDVFPLWAPGSVAYKKGDRVTYNGVLYRVITAHTSQESWKPDVSPSLFTKVLTSSEGPKEWEQPDSTNPYMKGDRVIYNGKIYESLIDNNVWSPDGKPDGWKEITE